MNRFRWKMIYDPYSMISVVHPTLTPSSLEIHPPSFELEEVEIEVSIQISNEITELPSSQWDDQDVKYVVDNRFDFHCPVEYRIHNQAEAITMTSDFDCAAFFVGLVIISPQAVGQAISCQPVITSTPDGVFLNAAP